MDTTLCAMPLRLPEAVNGPGQHSCLDNRGPTSGVRPGLSCASELSLLLRRAHDLCMEGSLRSSANSPPRGGSDVSTKGDNAAGLRCLHPRRLIPNAAALAGWARASLRQGSCLEGDTALCADAGLGGREQVLASLRSPCAWPAGPSIPRSLDVPAPNRLENTNPSTLGPCWQNALYLLFTPRRF